jgi:hypothetical protein
MDLPLGPESRMSADDKQEAEKVRQLRSRIVQTLNVPQRVRLRAFTRCGLAGRTF